MDSISLPTYRTTNNLSYEQNVLISNLNSSDNNIPSNEYIVNVPTRSIFTRLWFWLFIIILIIIIISIIIYFLDTTIMGINQWIVKAAILTGIILLLLAIIYIVYEEYLEKTVLIL